MNQMRVAEWDGGNAELDAAAHLYARTFAEHPYNEDRETSRAALIERVRRYRATKPQFRFLLAWDGTEIAGLVLGTGIAEGDWWRDHIVDFLSDDEQARWLQDECFAVIELAVTPLRRRNGLAGALMKAVLADLPYDTAVLGCDSEALAARNFYASQQWEEIVPDVRINHSPAFCILGRQIR